MTDERAPPQNGLGTAALVIGIFAVIFGIAFFPLGFVLGVVGIGLGIAGRKRARRGEATNGGAALTGVILSIVGSAHRDRVCLLRRLPRHPGGGLRRS